MYSGLFLTQKHEDQGSPHHDHRLQSVCVDHGREAPWGPKERVHQHQQGVPLRVPTLCWAALGRPENTGSPQRMDSGHCLPRPSCSMGPPRRRRLVQPQALRSLSFCPHGLWLLFGNIPSLFLSCAVSSTGRPASLPTPMPS